MAELSALLGSVLKELAQARYMADNYSCTLSELYENNPALRMFPVPRAEIEEAEFTLRFAVTDLIRAEGKLKHKVRETLGGHAVTIASAVLDNLANLDGVKAYPGWRDAVLAVGDEEQEDLRGAIVAGLLEGMMPRMSEAFVKGKGLAKIAGGIDRGSLSRSVNRRIRRWIAGLPFVREALAATIAESGEPGPATADHFHPFVQAIDKALDSHLDEVADDLGNLELEDLYALDIDATSDGLRDLPADAVTSLTIKLAVRNYIWSSAEGEDGADHRTLGPE